ncbi:MAG: hypothetical protein OEM85_09680 [Gammaproteobacteria bacterium]|nr:hypothetical protein [Gammaproteobacteria bacterium]MDH3373632.1 hypothetical protein [Gammaproteobacteria bacterium]
MKKLPRNVYPNGPSLYYVRKNKWTRLCRIDAPEEELHRELWKILSKGAGTLSGVMDDLVANRLPTKAMSTRLRKHHKAPITPYFRTHAT